MEDTVINKPKNTKIIAVDFDCTITNKTEYPIMGDLNSEAKKYLTLLDEAGYTLVLWTARNKKYYKEACEACKNWNLPLKLESQVFTNNKLNMFNHGYTGKLEAKFYIDDRAYLGKKFNWKKIYKYIIKNIK